MQHRPFLLLFLLCLPFLASHAAEEKDHSRTFTGHSHYVYAVAITPDGRRALSASSDKTLKLWDLNSGRELHTFTGHSDGVNAVAITPDGRRALSGSTDKTLKLWDLDSGRELRTFSGHSALVTAVAITPDGRRALSGSYDNTLKLWDLDNGRELRTFAGHSVWVTAVAITPDGRRALSGSWDNTLKLWDLDSGRELRTFTGHSEVVRAVAITPDGRRALSGSEDNTLKLWDLDSGRELRTFTGHSNDVEAVAITPDGRRALSGSGDKTLKLWDLDSGRELRTFTGHSDSVLAVAITPDGRRALSGSDDKTLKLWDISAGMPPVVAPVAPPQPPVAPTVVKKPTPTPQLPTQPRYALLIGNQNYPKFQPDVNHARPLKNPRADAEDLGALLKSYGFNVTVVTDADRTTMKAAVSKFTRQLPRDSTAFFFYAGHGIQLHDKTEGESNNYLLPVAENFLTPADVKHFGISAQWIRDELQGSPAQFKFMILDACREKMVLESDARGGLVSRGGFGAMGASGMVIAYAAARNQLAYDNESARNGVYTSQLLEAMRQGKHWTIEKVLKTANTAVVKMTKDTETPQEPWIEGNLLGDDFCLAGCQ